ncbi:hypothetical protein SAMN06265371_102416 [Lutibacter agarilyticus]|uniref:DUF1735 domain-containing protein n=1 Tax=Lutibacter agarilyticus TaxID=1109740 RepID=A0A238W4A6_9FLAO|nr:hypothetical protein [Lutibacter agarilyticus]SNR41392.1 hypothetical protein SAMN06265371_102416 [Lutibacter agarilyticus]
MKTLFKNIAILTILLATITACDEIEDLADVTKTVELTKQFKVELEGGDNAVETGSFNISILTPAVEPYADKLKNVAIEKITFEVLNYTGDALAEYKAQFTADGTPFINESFFGFEADANDTIFEVNDTSALNTVATKLLNNDSVTVSFNAESTNLEVAASFTIDVKFYIKVTANPL